MGKEGIVTLTVKLDRRGRVTIPKWLRELYGIRCGSVVTLEISRLEVVEK